MAQKKLSPPASAGGARNPDCLAAVDSEISQAHVAFKILAAALLMEGGLG